MRSSEDDGLPKGLCLSSRARLTPRALPLFDEPTLLHRVARALCGASCLPRKELFESWEVARRVRRRFRGGRVVDVACGHGLLAYLMLLLDDSSPQAVAVDVRLPKSADKVRAAMESEWPRLVGRVSLLARPLREIELVAGDLVVSVHACGGLTDDVLTAAIAASARVAVLPCCHDEALGDQGGVGGWVDPSLAMDVTRAARLRTAGYTVRTQVIPKAITVKNRLLMGTPGALDVINEPAAKPTAGP